VDDDTGEQQTDLEESDLEEASDAESPFGQKYDKALQTQPASLLPGATCSRITAL